MTLLLNFFITIYPIRLMAANLAAEPHLYPLFFLLAVIIVSLQSQWHHFTVTVVDFYISKIFCNSSPWTSATTLWNCWKHSKSVSMWSYYWYKSSLLGSKKNGVVSLLPLFIVIIWSYYVIPYHSMTLLLNFFITIYPKRTHFWQLINLHVSRISKLSCD